MFCKYCGNQLKEDSKFCENCGAEVNQHAASATPVAQTQPVQTANDAPKGLSIAGFICSFCAPLVGLILCCIALSKYKQSTSQDCINLAKNGKVIAIVGIVLTVIIFIASAALIAELGSTYDPYLYY